MDGPQVSGRRSIRGNGSTEESHSLRTCRRTWNRWRRGSTPGCLILTGTALLSLTVRPLLDSTSARFYVVVLRLRGHHDLVAFQGKNGTLSGIGSGSSTPLNSTSTRTPATRWCGASTLAGPRNRSWRRQRKVGKPRRLSGWCRRSRRASGRGPGPSGDTLGVRCYFTQVVPSRC